MDIRIEPIPEDCVNELRKTFEDREYSQELYRTYVMGDWETLESSKVKSNGHKD